MSSVVAETNMQVSTQTARSKPGQNGQRSGNDGFSGLVDENLAATHNGDPAPADRPRQPAREGSPDQSTRRTGVHARPRNQTEAARQPSDDPATKDTPPGADTLAPPTSATETPVRTGVVATEITAEPAEPVAQADAQGAPAPAPPESGAAVVANAATAQVQLEAGAGESVIESSDAITVSNPPATIAAGPAETAANALARVASDTSDAATTAPAETAAQAQPATGAATATDATESAPAAQADAGMTAAAPEADASAEATVKLEAAAADAQLDVKTDRELSAASKGADAAKLDEAAPPVQLTARADIKPAGKLDDAGAVAEEPPAQPDPRSDRRIEANVASEPRPGRPAETDARPAQRAAHEPAPAQPQPTSSEPPQPQPTGFGIPNATSHMPNVAIQAAQLTAVPAAVVPVPINGLAVEIAANVQIGRSRFEIRLDPPELGRIDVRLDVDRQGQVTSHLIVEKAATLDLLRRDAQQLERALQDAGLKTSDNGLQFSLRDQQQQAGRNDDNGSGRHTQRLIVAEEETIAAETVGRGYGRLTGQRGGVDIRV